MTSSLQRDGSVTDYLRTGSTQLDMAVSCSKSKLGGIPNNRIVEFSGTGASGKTYVCGEIAGDAIRKGYDVDVDDIERRWDLDRLDTFGFDYDDKPFHYLKPSSSIEECFAKLFKRLDKLKEKQKLLYIIDPIAALWAKQEQKSDKMSQARAKALQKHMRFLKDRMSMPGRDVSLIFSNQLIDAVGVIFGDKKHTPGGNALVHWPSVRIRFSASQKIIKEEIGRKEDSKIKKTIGMKMHGEVRKNSEDDAFRTADFTIINKYGIDDIHDNALWLKKHTNVLGESDGWFKLRKYKSIQGLDKFVWFIEAKNLERTLARITRVQYRKWYAPETRKPKRRV